MDCPSEEQMIRMKLDGLEGIRKLDFDIANRKLTVLHENDEKLILSELDTLNFDTSILSTEMTSERGTEDTGNQKRILWQVLIINFFFFLLEITVGFSIRSMSLVADSLDMLADAFVYSLALLAVGSTVSMKKKVAGISGYLQLILAVTGFVEVIRRLIEQKHVTDFGYMILISILALIGNAVSLYLLQKSRSKEVHMQASMIFTSNDIIVNLGVIVAGVLVFLTKSGLPDLLLGFLIFVLVTRGAFRILKLSR